MGNLFTPKVGGKRELALAIDAIHEKNYDQALAYAKQALSKVKERGNANEINIVNGRILEIQGYMHQERGNLKNASGAFGQSGRFFLQASQRTDAIRVIKQQAKLLIQRGKKNADSKKFESAAALYEEAAIALKSIDLFVDALETRAKAFVFRAASVRNVADRKAFLLQAVDLIKKSGIEQPVVLGHLEYYSAMAERLSDGVKAIAMLDRAIEHYIEADNKIMIQTAKALQEVIRRSLADD